MSTTYVVGVRIDGNAASYLRMTQQAGQATRTFARGAKAEFDKLRQYMTSLQGQFAGLGAGIGLIQIQRNAAKLEKTLTQVRLTAGMTAAEQTEAYQVMFDLVKRNGGVIEDTVGGYNNLIQAGLKYKEAIEATKAVSLAKAVTGASDDSLSGSLTVGAANFNFDLAQAGVATRMLDEMTVAGRLGNAELEQLSNIFPRVAQRAQSAGMGFQQTLAFIEGLSQVERQPERLATLADSTLRLFTNARYAQAAEQATGIKFFSKDGSRRDSMSVLEDMRKQFGKLTTDAQRFQYVTKAFGEADLDTQRGLAALLSGNGLQNIRQFETAIKNAGGTLERDLPTAINNAADQSSRLKNTLREAAEGFARPINDAVSSSIKYALDAKDKGGLGLSGGQIAGGAVAGAGVLYALSRFLPPMLSKLVGRGGGLAAGVAEGKALEAAAGITPVYVTNWAEMGGASGGTVETATALATGATGGALAKKAAGPVGRGAVAGLTVLPVVMAVGGAAAAGYGIGAAINKTALEGTRASDVIGGVVARTLALFGNEEAKRSVAATDAFEQSLKNAEVKGEIRVSVSGAPGLNVQADLSSLNPRVPLRDLGKTMMATGY